MLASCLSEPLDYGEGRARRALDKGRREKGVALLQKEG